MGVCNSHMLRFLRVFSGYAPSALVSIRPQRVSMFLCDGFVVFLGRRIDFEMMGRGN